MKIVGVIPARYKSSRFPGKPLADICGKPMIWWVYNQAIKVEVFDNANVATNDEWIHLAAKIFTKNKWGILFNIFTLWFCYISSERGGIAA